MSGLQLIFATDDLAPRAVSLTRLRLGFARGYRASSFAVDSRACVVPARSGVSAWYVAKSSSVPSFAFIDLGFDPCRDECDMPYDQKVVFDQFLTWMKIFQRK